MLCIAPLVEDPLADSGCADRRGPPSGFEQRSCVSLSGRAMAADTNLEMGTVLPTHPNPLCYAGIQSFPPAPEGGRALRFVLELRSWNIPASVNRTSLLLEPEPWRPHGSRHALRAPAERRGRRARTTRAGGGLVGVDASSETEVAELERGPLQRDGANRLGDSGGIGSDSGSQRRREPVIIFITTTTTTTNNNNNYYYYY